MLYGSVCSGIEAASVAWEPLGWRAAFFSEIEAFPRAVLTHRFPEVSLHGDFTTIEADDYEPIELLVGGTPCQDFSVAGLRAGMDGARGNLTLEFLALTGRLRPRWLVWENVPGVLSIDGGRAFGAILGGMGQLGYGFAYRILDAQHFGIPQRRRRVFVVGYLGDWRPAAAVLLERASLRGDSPPRREAGEGIARPVASSAPGGSGYRNDADTADNLIAATLTQKMQGASNQWAPWNEADNLIAGNVAPPITSNPYGDHESREGLLIAGTVRSHPRPGSNSVGAIAIKGAAIGRKPENGPQYGEVLTNGTCYTLNCTEQHAVAHTLRADGFDASDDGTGRGTPLVALDWQNSVAFNRDASPKFGNVAAPLKADQGSGGYSSIGVASAVRRLTPRECERLQGFPDDWTLVPYRGKPAADGPRYRAIGNSMAVPCMAWIAQRIEAVERLTNGLPAAATAGEPNSATRNVQGPSVHALNMEHGVMSCLSDPSAENCV